MNPPRASEDTRADPFALEVTGVSFEYFPELGYTRLYRCAATAEVEIYGPDDVARSRFIRNLATNRLEARPDLDPSGRRPIVSERRWESFKADVTYFRRLFPRRSWATLFADHGFNPTPAWTLLGSLVTNLGPLRTGRSSYWSRSILA